MMEHDFLKTLKQWSFIRLINSKQSLALEILKRSSIHHIAKRILVLFIHVGIPFGAIPVLTNFLPQP
jgi:hypothetical protein